MKTKPMLKKLSALFLSLCIMGTMLAGLTLPVAAATSGITGDCTWTLNGTTLTISGNGAMANYLSYSSAPWGKSIEKVVIADGVTTIGKNAFPNCTSLERVTISDSVISIGDNAFLGCSSLTRVTIPNSVISIGSYAFRSCTNLTSVSIPDGVTSILNSTFKDCNSLSKIYISDTLKKIEWYAFNNCTSLKSVYFFGDDKTTISIGAGNDYLETAKWYCTCRNHIYDNACDKTCNRCDTIREITHTYDDDCDATCNICGTARFAKHIYDDYTDGWCNRCNSSRDDIGEAILIYENYGENVTWYLDSNGVLTICGVGKIEGQYSGTKMPWYPYKENINAIIVKEGITCIPSYCFEYLGNVRDVKLPKGLLTLYCNAFNDCASLNNMIIPNTVTELYMNFNRCTLLTEVFFEGTTDEWRSVKNHFNVYQYSNIEKVNCLTYYPKQEYCTEIGHEGYYKFDNTNNFTIYDENKNIISEIVKIQPKGHTPIGTADCINDQVCEICGIILVEKISHSYDEGVVTDPTSTTQGYTIYTCTVCGYSYKDNYTEATANTVQNMQITATDTDITVTWEAIEGTTRYNLYVNDAEGNNLITRALAADKTSVTLSWPTELEWDKNYTIGIRAKTTKWLDTVYKTAALTVANRIVDVKTQSVGRTIKVDWRAYDGATQYYVYVYKKGAYSEGAITSVKATTNSATIINAINPEVDYEVRVIATKGVTKMKTADALVIDARLNVFTPDTFTERGITPTKVGIGFDEVRGADKYWVYLIDVNSGEEIIKESTRAIAAVGSLAPNTEYTVQIQARIVDANGVAHYSGKSAVLGTIKTSDWEDIGFTATATNSGAELTWNAPTNAYGYVIYRSTNGGKSYKGLAAITDPSTTSYVDTNAKSGYMYAIVMQLQDDFVAAKSSLIKSNEIIK